MQNRRIIPVAAKKLKNRQLEIYGNVYVWQLVNQSWLQFYFFLESDHDTLLYLLTFQNNPIVFVN